MGPRICIAIALIVGVTACAGNRMNGSASRGDLFGAWELDRAASDSLRDPTASEARQESGANRVGGRFPRRGEHPDVLRALEEDAAEMRRVLDVWNRANERLAITAAAGVVRIEYADSSRLELVANGRKLRHDFRGFRDVESAAKWEAGSLEVEHRVGRVRLTETYTRAPESPRLILMMELKGRVPRALKVRRVFVARPDESG